MKLKQKLLITAGLIGFAILIRERVRKKEPHKADLAIAPRKEQARKAVREQIQEEKKQSNPIPIQAPMENPQNPFPSIKKETQPLPVPVGDEFPLRLGSKGPKVERLQVYIMRKHGIVQPITGELNETTFNAMKRYLKTEALSQNQFESLNMGMHVQDQRKRRK